MCFGEDATQHPADPAPPGSDLQVHHIGGQPLQRLLCRRAAGRRTSSGRLDFYQAILPHCPALRARSWSRGECTRGGVRRRGNSANTVHLRQNPCRQLEDTHHRASGSPSN